MKAIKKLIELTHYKGYSIDFTTNNNPDFEKFRSQLNSIGTWITKQENLWVFTSTITDKEKFISEFIKITELTKNEFTLEERHFPFVAKY